MPPVTVIPTCADLDRFIPHTLTERNEHEKKFVLGYIGSVGTFYLFDEVISCFIQLLIINPNSK